MAKLEKEFTIVSDYVRLLRNENNTLKAKAMKLEKAKNELDVLMKEKVKKLEMLLDDKNTEVEDLWGVIQITGAKNMKLRAKEKVLESCEKQLKKDIKLLKMTVAKHRKTGIYSQDTANWKEKMDNECLAWRNRT